MNTKKNTKPKTKPEQQTINEDELPEIDLSSCESFDPASDQCLSDDDSCDEDFDFE